MEAKPAKKNSVAKPADWAVAEIKSLKQRFNEILKLFEIQEDKSFLLCPDCAKEESASVPLYWVNADQLSFGDYVEVRAEARCKECDSYWQIKIPQMVRAQPQNRLSNIEAY